MIPAAEINRLSKAHRWIQAKVSNDPKFTEKLIDVVGLYLNPPETAIVLCMDEKSSIHALDRTQASLPHHRHKEFLTFLRTIDRQVPNDLAIHMVLDNYATHKHAKITAWLAEHTRFHLHFIPTSSSWLNQVERWFRALTDKNLKRGIFPSVPALIDSINTFINAHNNDPKPYVWTATTEQILVKVASTREKLDQLVKQN